ncbi:MAG: CoA pyrophosphatase [Hyphomicrobiaceae bacterium]|nr:CoA pyrophosphatase [Hyphomicrobiaceae bacterium]
MKPDFQIDDIYRHSESFRIHAGHRLSAEPSQHVFTPGGAPQAGTPSDFDLNPDLAGDVLDTAPPRAAAVLVPVVARDPLTVLLTLRTEHLAAHAGQVAFPGGKIDDGDAGALDAALREAEEEIALDRSLVEPLGFLDTYRTGTGYAIFPVVALVDPGYVPRPDPREVAAVFEVPLAYLMDERNVVLDRRIWRGRERQFYAFTYRPHYIWGATAGMLRNMQERLFRK